MAETLLNEGQELSDANRDKDLYRRMRKSAMDLLARREHSVVEIQRKLLKKFSDYTVIDCVLSQLVEENLLSDSRFAEAYVRYRSAAGFGPERIKGELRERGVKENLISQFLYGEYTNWMEIAAQAYRKKFGSVAAQRPEEKARRFRFMQYRGFSAEQINKCCSD